MKTVGPGKAVEHEPRWRAPALACDAHFHVFGPASTYPHAGADLRYAPPVAPFDDYLQTVERFFQKHELGNGTMHVRNEKVDPSAIQRTALMTVEGELDDISAPGQTIAAQAICASIPANRRTQYLQPGVGHYGIFNGRKWRSDILPRISAFMAAS